jgi:hypothetical protein
MDLARSSASLGERVDGYSHAREDGQCRGCVRILVENQAMAHGNAAHAAADFAVECFV